MVGDDGAAHLRDEVGYLRGEVEMLTKRVDKISERLDSHITQCSSRFGIMLAAIAAAGGVVAFLARGH